MTLQCLLQASMLVKVQEKNSCLLYIQQSRVMKYLWTSLLIISTVYLDHKILLNDIECRECRDSACIFKMKDLQTDTHS